MFLRSVPNTNGGASVSETSRKVLCVDDEVNLLNGLRRQMRRKFDLVTATSGSEALDVLNTQGPFAVVVSDYNMPEMDGIELLKQVHFRSPETVTVMLTGKAGLDVAVSALHEGGIYRFLNKPCPAQILETTIRDCLEQYRLVVAERTLSKDLNDKNQQLNELNQELANRVAERTATILGLYQFVTDLNGLDTLEEIAQLVVTTTAEVLNSNRVSLMLPDKDGSHLTIMAAVGIPETIKKQARIPIGAPIAGRVYAESQSIVVNDPDELNAQTEQYDSIFFASVPLVSTLLLTPSGPIGVLNITEPASDEPYRAEELANLRAISEAAAIALRNQIRLIERNEARDATVLAMAKLAEQRDPETGAHLERVQRYCQILAETLSEKEQYRSVINRSFIENIFRSSPLHDIGKVGIPDDILLKPGRLTPEEFDAMKQHSKIGGDTIWSVMKQGYTQDFLKMGMEIAYYHHEKFDGSGYPNGLAGESIPLSARIMAVADVYDALTSKRVYKEAMPHAKAAGIIRKDVGSHFDPDVVEAFDQKETEFQTLAVKLGDHEIDSPVDLNVDIPEQSPQASEACPSNAQSTQS